MPIQNNKSNNNKSKFNLTWVYVAVLAFVFFFIMTNNEESMMKVNYTKFQECLDSGYVANIKVDKTEQELFFELKPDSIVPAANILPKEAKAKSALVTNFATVDVYAVRVPVPPDHTLLDVHHAPYGRRWWRWCLLFR